MENRQYYFLPEDKDIPKKYRGQLCCIGVLSKYEKYSFDMVRVNIKGKYNDWYKFAISQSRLIPVQREIADIMEGYDIPPL